MSATNSRVVVSHVFSFLDAALNSSTTKSWKPSALEKVILTVSHLATRISGESSPFIVNL